MPSAPKRVSSTQGLSVRLHAPAYKTTMLHPFFFKQTAFPLSHDRHLGANKKKKTKFYLHLTSSEKHLPETNPGERASRGRCAAASASGPAAITSGATASQAEVRSPGGGCLGTRRRRLPRWGAGPGWRRRRPGRPRRSSSRRRCSASSSTTRASGRARERYAERGCARASAGGRGGSGGAAWLDGGRRRAEGAAGCAPEAAPAGPVQGQHLSLCAPQALTQGAPGVRLGPGVPRGPDDVGSVCLRSPIHACVLNEGLSR